MLQLYFDRQTCEYDGVALSDMVKGFWVCMFTVCFIICIRKGGWVAVDGKGLKSCAARLTEI